MTNTDFKSEVDRLVNRGIVLGTIWIFGVGSVIALISGFQASRIISKNNLKPDNKKVALCYIIGILGLLLWVVAITIIIVFRKK